MCVHAELWGGRRSFKFTPAEQALVELYIWSAVKRNPCRTCAEYASDVSAAINETINEKWVQRLFVRWGFTRKIPMHKQAGSSTTLCAPLELKRTGSAVATVQINKFTADNIAYYVQFVMAIKDLNPFRIKYCDECHFESKCMCACVTTDWRRRSGSR